jgi:gamma-tubulin complex component 2
VFSKGLLLKYQLIFRHLLYCRYVERKLVEVWVDHQCTKELGLDQRFSPSYSLRQRMLHFCRDYIYYATVEVLEPQSHHFLASLEQAETIDVVLRSHETFLNSCLQELLLTEREQLYRGLSKVLSTCYTFAMNLHKFSSTGAIQDSRTEHDVGAAQPSGVRRVQRVQQSYQAYLSILSQKHYAKMISKFKEIFETQLQSFLHHIRVESTTRHEHFLSNMLTRLDYNDYYSHESAALARHEASRGLR